MSPIERLKQHRLEMQRAIADGVSLSEARKRMAHDRWLAAQARLAALREVNSQHQPAEPAVRAEPWMMRE